MKQVKEFSIKIFAIIFIFGLYLLACRYHNDDVKLNDLSYVNNVTCENKCEKDNVQCLKLCSENMENNKSSTYILLALLSILVFIVSITYLGNEFLVILEHIKEKLGYESKYSKLNIHDEVEEDEMFHYKKISDI